MQSEWDRCWERIVVIYFPVNVTFKREEECPMANKHGLSTASIPFRKQLWVYCWFKANWIGLVVVPSEAEERFSRSGWAALNASGFWVTLQETGCLGRISNCSVSIRELRQTGKLIPQRKWVSHMQLLQKQLFGTEQSPDKLCCCLASSIDISLNPKTPAWTHRALCHGEPNLDAHADLEA